MTSLPAYAELHCISNFTFLTGGSHPEELIEQAAQLGYQALAITDECSVAGVVRAFAAIQAKQLAIKLIIGTRLQLTAQLQVVLLCPNRLAYNEMCQLISQGRRRSEKGEYQLFIDDLKILKHCFLLWLAQLPEQHAIDTASWLKNNLTIPIWIVYERLLNTGEYAYQQLCERLSTQFDFKLVCAGGVQMHDQQRQPLQDVLTAIRLGCSVDQAGFSLNPNGERYLRPREKLAKLYPAPLLAETIHIAQQCHFDLATISYQYPSEVVPKGLTAQQYLRQQVEAGIKIRFGHHVEPAIRALIEKELQLINEENYAYFFLTLYDIVQFAKSKQILYQGRGSAANSVVCYCLEITAVDPTKIQVLFERFISKERKEPPDIDVDFEHERREEIIQYIYQKYGRERAALAAAVHTFKLKGAIRAVGKVLGFQLSQLEYLIKNINRRDPSQSWQQQISQLGVDQQTERGYWFLHLVAQIIGFPRHLSQHVGGFVIAKGPLHHIVPIENAAMADRTVIQWDKNDIATLKLLKVDILALGMLSAVRKCFALMQHHYQRPLDMAYISNLGDDPKVFNMLQKADSIGVFQVESRAQMSMLPRLKPRCYYDLVIQIAIVRPGPIQGDMVHPYLRRRSGQETIDYPSKAVEEVLSRTLGVPIFQEQVIKLAMVAAGFTGGEADQLRRAMARWKKTGEMDGFRHKLINGMQQRGYNSEFAERIFKQICGFGEYGFPESHSASFALLAYCSAWLKYYYPAAFYCALLNSLPMGFYSASQLIQDAQRHDIHILPIDINQSDNDHQLVPSLQQTSLATAAKMTDGNDLAIQLGFRIVKGLSNRGIELILAKRPATGFVHLKDVQLLGLNKADQSALASADALKSLAGNRYQARWDMLASECSLPLFTHLIEESQTLYQVPSELDNLTEDFHATGLSLGQHPIAILRQQNKLGRHTCAKDLGQQRHQSLVTVVGIVTGKQSPDTAAGVTFITLEDDTGNINVVVWKNTAQQQKQPFLTAAILKINGIVEREADVIHVIAGKLFDVSHLLYPKSLHHSQCRKIRHS